jgi:hypothetical protein
MQEHSNGHLYKANELRHMAAAAVYILLLLFELKFGVCLFVFDENNSAKKTAFIKI